MLLNEDFPGEKGKIIKQGSKRGIMGCSREKGCNE